MADKGFTPFTAPEEVVAYLQPLLERLAMVFSTACESATSEFKDKGWSAESALAAYLVRKEVFENLRAVGEQVEEEDVEVDRKALCGLLLRTPLVHLKIRKSKDGEIPPAGSERTLSFYNWNLLVFPRNEGDDALPLHLLLLWNDNKRGQLDTLLLACVEGSEWRWRVQVFQRASDLESDDARSVADEELSVTSEDYTAAFDSANEDLPLKLNRDQRQETAESVDAEAKQNDLEEQGNPKKKAQ